jgi:hypothetical protein
MKKLLLLGLIAGALLPGLAFAAYNDVTLTTDAIITVNGMDLTVSGSSAVVETIVVNSGNFTVTLPTDSTMTVSAVGKREFTYEPATGAFTKTVTCSADNSVLTLTGSGSGSNVITVTAAGSTCTAAGAASRSGGSSGGGGSSSAYHAPVTPVTSLVPVLAPVQTTPASSVKITSNLSAGSRGASVKTLQQFLNTHGFAITSSGPGSRGNETENLGNLTVQAVRKFQEKYGIAKFGLPGYGAVGPKTRAKINELSGN